MHLKTNHSSALQLNVALSDEEEHLAGLDLSFHHLFLLAGGFPTPLQNKYQLNVDMISRHVVELELLGTAFRTLCRLNFKQHTYHLNFLEVFEDYRREKVGISLFLNLLKAASANGFNKIEVEATKGTRSEGRSPMIGHYYWALLGFKMDADARKQLRQWCRDQKFKELEMFEILQDLKKREAWLYSGFTWRGYFDIKDAIQCMGTLKEFLAHREVQFSL